MSKIFSVRAMERIFKSAGAKVVSQKAALRMRKLIEDYAEVIARRAVKNALYEGRKTVKSEDLEEQ